MCVMNWFPMRICSLPRRQLLVCTDSLSAVSLMLNTKCGPTLVSAAVGIS
jgi:hypothetical protein